jgi:hypothetical protein
MDCRVKPGNDGEAKPDLSLVKPREDICVIYASAFGPETGAI